jgi:hypothetical protein
VQHKFSAVLDYRVSGIIPALVANYVVGVFGQNIDDFALSFVAPLSAYHDRVRHISTSLKNKKRASVNQGIRNGVSGNQAIWKLPDTGSPDHRMLIP